MTLDIVPDFIRIKTSAATIKRSPTDGTGRVAALVSTFGPPPDSQGDIVSPHAFDATIARASVERPGKLFPIWWQHGYADPANAIGVVTSAAVTPQGLIVEGQLAIDSSAKAMDVYGGLLSGALNEWSISYGIIEQHTGTWGGEPVNYLDEVELLEISAVWKGANRNTRTLAIKQAPAVPDELLRVKARIADALGTPEPSDPASVRARIDAALGPKPIDVDAVAAYLAEFREARKAEEAERARRQERDDALAFHARALSRQTLAENIADEAERDRVRREAELAEWERRAAEREVERLQSEQAEEERHAAALANPLIHQGR